MMLLIGIDGNEANVKERVGVNVWAWEILKSLANRLLRAAGGGSRNDISVQVYLSKSPLSDLPEETEFWKYRVIGPGKFWTRWRLPLDLYFHEPRPDVFLSLSHYSPLFAPMPRIVSIMDLSFLKYPEVFKPLVLWQLKNWTKESIKKSKRVITISKFDKREIIDNYKCVENEIEVVCPGVREKFTKFLELTDTQKGSKIQIIRRKFKLDSKYLLFVGTKQKKKNLKRLLEAFELVRKENPEVQLVVAGKVWGQFAEEKEEESASWRRMKEEGITYLGYVNEDDLPALYAGTEALILPSLYEGFGIPTIEAMSLGIPVLVSDITSLPEIVGNAGILFNPYDVSNMAEKICRLLNMSRAERQQLIKKGMIRARNFSWDKSAMKVMNLLELVAQNKDHC